MFETLFGLFAYVKEFHRFVHQKPHLVRSASVGFREVVVASGSYDNHIVLRNHDDVLTLEPKKVIMFNRVVVIDPEAHAVNFVGILRRGFHQINKAGVQQLLAAGLSVV